ncbi:PID-CTERM protein-sorting domain-containing protein [Fodinibius halophilus]|uniref:Uncharacterized protein n=1 Tax=Fodinibius halophilus TaxID=1736908 RepID=A0A6M1T5X7_9BACT|nr:hypothetical protein [Fodinibius halophilus]NGP89469.1 hypothetical protein [Fodinibius halophilus]
MKITTILLLTLVIIFITVTLTLAQPGLPGSPEQTPIDGGLGILAALGGSYAIKKLRDKKQD